MDDVYVGLVSYYVDAVSSLWSLLPAVTRTQKEQETLRWNGAVDT